MEDSQQSSRSSAKSAANKIFQDSRPQPKKEKDVNLVPEIATIIFFLNSFREALLEPVRAAEEQERIKAKKFKKKGNVDDDLNVLELADHTNLEKSLRDPLRLESRQVITDTIKILLEHFPRRKKITDNSWCYLLRKVIDSNQEDYGLTNPMKCSESLKVNAFEVRSHPFFSLSISIQVKILYHLCNWALETDTIKNEIDASLKSIKRGVRPIQVAINPIGMDRNKALVFHLPSTTFIYLQTPAAPPTPSSRIKITCVTTSMQEFEKYVANLESKGPESAVKAYFNRVLDGIKAEIAEKERKEELRLHSILKKEQKRLEYEQWLLAPRRASRATRAKQNYDDFFHGNTSSTDEDDLIMRDSDEDEEEEEKEERLSASDNGDEQDDVQISSSAETGRGDLQDQENAGYKKSPMSSASSSKENLDHLPTNPKLSKEVEMRLDEEMDVDPLLVV